MTMQILENASRSTFSQLRERSCFEQFVIGAALEYSYRRMCCQHVRRRVTEMDRETASDEALPR